MNNQKKRIRFYLFLINLCRKYQWLIKFPILNLLQGSHKIFARKKYFMEVMRLIGRKPNESYEFYKNEILNDKLLRRNYLDAIETRKLQRKYKRYEDRFENEANVVQYYALLRELKPKIVVETGTASGSMTSWMLAALSKNGNGKLISIDIPALKGELTMDIDVAKDEIGFLIPHEFHDAWELILGDAKVFLPKIMAEYDVDIFVHDSLHTRTHMLFEYNVAHALMRPRNIIMSDDILWNTSFFDFVKSNKLHSVGCISNPNIGLTVNTFDQYENEIGVGIVRSN